MVASLADATLWHMHARARDAGRLLGLAILYVAFARLGLSLGAVDGLATLVWPPTGMSIAALLLLGVGAWPGVFLGAVVASLLNGQSVLVAVGIGVGNAAEAIVCVYIATRLSRFRVALENVGSVTALVPPPK